MPRRTTNRRLRCGIVGAGNIAWRYEEAAGVSEKSLTHASCIVRHPDTDLVALTDPNPEALSAFCKARPNWASNMVVTESIASLLEQELDFISVCSPSELHTEHFLTCLEAGPRFIWLEKPASISLSEFERAVTAIQKMDRPPRVSVNYFRRTLPHFRKLIELVRFAGQRPNLIEIKYSRGLSLNGVHMLDILGACFDGQPPRHLDWLQGDTPDHCSFGFQADGVKVAVHGLEVPYHCIEFRVTFADRRLSLVQGGQAVFEEKRIENPVYPKHWLLDEPHRSDLLGDSNNAMSDPIYPNFCNLLNEKQPLETTLESERYVQVLLAQVQAAFSP